MDDNAIVRLEKMDKWGQWVAAAEGARIPLYVAKERLRIGRRIFRSSQRIVDPETGRIIYDSRSDKRSEGP